MIKHIPLQAKIDMANGVSPSAIAKVYNEYFRHENEIYLEWLCKYYSDMYEKTLIKKTNGL